MFFVLLILKKNLLSKSNMFFFLEQKLFFRIQFPNTFFFFENTKNYSQKLFAKQFSKTATRPKVSIQVRPSTS